MKTLWIAFALLGLVYGLEVNTDGTPVDVGGDGSEFTTFDADGVKIKGGVNCYKDDSEATTFNMVLRAYNNDQARDMAGDNPYFLFNQCEAIQHDMLASNMALEANPKCSFTQSGDNNEYFLLDTTVDTEAAMTCGIEKAGDVYKFGFRCQRNGAYIAKFDTLFTGSCEFTNGAQVLTATLTGSLLVGPVAEQSVLRRPKVTMEFVASDTPPDPTNDVALGATKINVGTSIYLRMTLTVQTDQGDTRVEFEEGFGPVGIKINKCTAKRHPDQVIDTDEGADNDPGADGVDFIVNNCGVDTFFAQQILNTRPKWIKGSDEGDNAHKKIPNVWYIGGWEAKMFLPKKLDAASTYKTLVTCEIEPATSFTDTTVFGDLANALAGTMKNPTYDGCTTKRRRRSPAANYTDFPTSVSAVLNINVREEDLPNGGNQRCIENTTFYTLTGILSALLLIVLAIGGYLTLKLRRAMNDRDRDDSSLSGIPNKAYY